MSSGDKFGVLNDILLDLGLKFFCMSSALSLPREFIFFPVHLFFVHITLHHVASLILIEGLRYIGVAELIESFGSILWLPNQLSS